ncbi:MAG: diguanylate cyclase [Burkholderiales bacterium]|nr:diguanylate cyclase [Burkholderiales bacterium]
MGCARQGATHAHTLAVFGHSLSSRTTLSGTDHGSSHKSHGSAGTHTSQSSHTELDNHAILLASQSLSSETSLPRLVAILIDIVSKITGATGCAFLLADDAGQWYLEGGAIGTQPLVRQQASACEGIAFPGAVMRLGLKLGKPVVSDDAVQDKRFARDTYFQGLPLCSVLGFPVQVRGRSAGFLVLENRLIHAAFSAEQVQSVSMLAGQLAISIENARLYESLESKVAERTRELEISNAKLAALSSTDGLTGIANRRRFDEAFALEWARAKRNRQPLSVAMLDVDWFKKYNDHYGHQAGDECLRQVASVLVANVRRSGDLVARYGGEEFILIAPDTDKDAALRMASNICHALAQLALPHAMSPYGYVTASMGVATLVPLQHCNSPELLVKQADDALYQAKEQGRNRALACEVNR